MAFMFWQKRSIQLILGLPLAMPMVSHAIEVGDTYVESGQNQPLNASINVTDIDPATFSVKLGNPAMYQQLGLSADQPIKVRFQPTSSNGGKIILTSTQPVATPYADVVLDIQNKGEKKVLPKTLLMPLGSNPTSVKQAPAPLVVPPEPTKVTVANNPKIELPATTATATPSEPVPSEPVIATPQENPKTETATVTQPSNEPILATSGEKPVTATLLPNGKITYKTDSLVIQETKPVGDAETATSTTTTTIPADGNADAKTPTKKDTDTATSGTTETTDNPDTTTETVTYVIQRNENLWTIANRVAKSTKTDVHEVMKKIVADNPDAFENGDPSKIIANTKLNLPKYQTVPSQAGIKSARKIRKQAGKARKAVYTKTTAKPVTAPKMAKPVVTPKHAKKAVPPRKHYPIVKQKYTPPATPISQPKPRKTEMVIVAPQPTSGSAQGTVKTTTTTTKVVNSQVAAQLQQKRQATAAQAAKVNQLNNTISSSEMKIKIQNQKLAQLEQRLKELNKK